MGAYKKPMPHSRDLHILTHEFYPSHGGAGVVADQLARAAKCLNKRVRVWVPRRHTAAIKAQTAPPFAVIPIPVKGSMDWSCRVGHALQVSRYMSRYGFGDGALIHIAEPGAVLAWMYLQLRKNFPQKPRKIITLHGSEILKFTESRHRRMLFRRLLGQCEKIHLLSEANSKLLQERFPGIDPTKIKMIPGAPRNLKAAPQHLNIPTANGRTIILSVGRIHPRKGHRHLLQTAEQLPKHLHDSIAIWYAGRVVDKSYQKQLELLASRSKIPIHFLGAVSDGDLHRLYSAADIFAMTSRQEGSSIEGFGLVYLEASQAGLPVLANETGGVAEVVLHNHTGLLSQPDDSATLLKNLRQLIEQAALRNRLGENGRAFAAQHSWLEAARSLYC